MNVVYAVQPPGPSPTVKPPAPGAPVQCGSPSFKPNVFSSRIVGGSEAVPHSWPWQCLVVAVYGGFSYRCGGSVIGSNHILTAAHCL